ncbi:MAG: hypothetical protein WC932_04945 [archaeon]
MIEVDLKRKYGRVFRAVLPSKTVLYFRLLSKTEYDMFARLHPSMEADIPFEAEEYVINTAVVYPSIQELDLHCGATELKAVVPHIIVASGFSDLETFLASLAEKREEMGLLSEQIIATIMRGMPAYRREDIQKLNYEEIAHLLALTEIITGEMLNIGDVQEDTANPLYQANAKPKAPRVAMPDIAHMSESEKAVAEKLRQKGLEALSAIRARR